MTDSPEEMSGEVSEPNRNRYQSIAIAVLIVVAGIAAWVGFGWWETNRVRGEITAEQVAADYVAAPCEARPLYDGRTWTVTGVVVPRDLVWIPSSADPNGYFALAGGTHLSDGNGCPGAVFRPFIEAGEYTPNLMFEWDDDASTVAVVGEEITVTCTLKLIGFGLNDGGGGIAGSGCVPG